MLAEYPQPTALSYLFLVWFLPRFQHSEHVQCRSETYAMLHRGHGSYMRTVCLQSLLELILVPVCGKAWTGPSTCVVCLQSVFKLGCYSLCIVWSVYGARRTLRLVPVCVWSV